MTSAAEKRLEEIKKEDVQKCFPSIPCILEQRHWLIARLEAEAWENERLRKQILADASTFEARLLAEIDRTNELLVVAEARCAELEAQASEAEAHIRELETQIADAARIAESQEGKEEGRG
jgi:predicted  nucleic acid-binding Zn-ribbon protein